MKEHGGCAIVNVASAPGVGESVTQAHPSGYDALEVDVDLRALSPLLLLAVALAVYALIDLVRAPTVRYLPKWAWALICVISMPLGPLAYLTLGRAPR